MSFLSVIRIVALWFILNLQQLPMENPLQGPIRMPGKNKTKKEVSSPREGLHIGKGYD